MTRRFIIFLIGVFIGVLFIRFVFPGRFSEYMQYFDLDYRVVYHLDQDTIYISANAQCHLQCLSKTQEEVLEIFQDGKVNFDLSDTKSECKKYVLENKDLSAEFELCGDKVKLQHFNFNFEDSCECNN